MHTIVVLINDYDIHLRKLLTFSITELLCSFVYVLIHDIHLEIRFFRNINLGQMIID